MVGHSAKYRHARNSELKYYRYYAEKRRIMDRLGECLVLTQEQEVTLQSFQREIASRMTDDVPAVDRMQLYDILRVAVVYDSNTGDTVISGLSGESTVNVRQMT
jgi:hypothetical protein